MEFNLIVLPTSSSG